MTRSICSYYEQQDLLYENIVTDLVEKFKSTTHLENLDTKVKKLKKNYKKNLKDIENKLIKANINVEKIKSIVKKHAENVKSDLGTKDPKIIAKSLVDNIHNSFAEVQREISIPEQIFLSIITLVAVFVVCIGFQIFVVIMCIGLGLTPAISELILIIFIAPLVEEYSKYLSVKYNYTGAYFIVFNSVEFFGYVFRMLSAGMNPIMTIISRLLAVGMHAITTYIQYSMRKNAKENKEDPEEASKLGLMIGIAIHFFWNLSAVALHFASRV